MNGVHKEVNLHGLLLIIYTVFPRNLAVARFYFKAPFGAATIRGRLDFEGGVYRDRYPRHVHSFNNKPSCMHVKCPCAYGNFYRPLTMRRDFEGGVYWDEMADRCGDISRAAGFRGNTVNLTEDAIDCQTGESTSLAHLSSPTSQNGALGLSSNTLIDFYSLPPGQNINGLMGTLKLLCHAM